MLKAFNQMIMSMQAIQQSGAQTFDTSNTKSVNTETPAKKTPSKKSKGAKKASGELNITNDVTMVNQNSGNQFPVFPNLLLP